MAPDALGALALFAFVSSITPGPNNMMLMSSGLTFGFARTLPHMWGVAFGFTLMVFAIGIGLGAVFEAFPALDLALKIASFLYLLYLAWKIANAGPIKGGASISGAPMTLLQAATFQWINPKAWVMAINATAAYAPKGNLLLGVGLVSLVFGLVNLPCIGAWVLFGNALRALMADPRWVRRINIAMALALAASLYPIAGELLQAWRARG